MGLSMTHWDGCWEADGHHDCAKAKIVNQKAYIAKLMEILEQNQSFAHELNLILHETYRTKKEK